MSDYNKLVSEVVSLSRMVGDFMKNEHLNFDPRKIEYKGKNDLVSYVDKQAEKKFIENLRDIFPEAGFITEEGLETTKGEEYNWVIDPLDGTTNFTHGIPLFSSSIALMKQKKVVLGVIHAVMQDETYFATADGKAYCNGDEIQVSSRSSLSDSLIATGYPYSAIDKLPVFFEIFSHFMRETHGVRRLGSAAIDLAYVAQGRVEGFFEFNLHPWDMAAGVLIVERAGGIVTDFHGGDNSIFGGKIIAGCEIQPDMLKVIQSIWERSEPKTA
jgi:myo-inositol-1(or 4)-monophosphatase